MKSTTPAITNPSTVPPPMVLLPPDTPAVMNSAMHAAKITITTMNQGQPLATLISFSRFRATGCLRSVSVPRSSYSHLN